MTTCPILRAATTPFRGRPSRPKQTSLTLFPSAARHGHCESACEASSPTPEPDRSSKPAAELVGIARFAASSPCADARRGTEYFLLPVRSILNRCNSERVPFRWTVNPYRGCEFGCRYCYARYTHEYMELDGADFEKKIYAKRDAGPIAARDLDNEKIWGEHIAIGTATDPYQPAERTFRATRTILEEMARREGLSISITTKSDQVVRDIDVLKRIAERSSVSVNLSITTLRTRLARLLEPRAPRPDLRLGAVRRLRDAGIAAGVLAMPVLPGLTDEEKDLDALARAARDAGAQWFAANVLFLMPSSQKQFLPFIDQKFPKLARRYREWYGRNGYAPESYQQAIARRVEALRQKYSLGGRPSAPARAVSHSPQLTLGLAPSQPRSPHIVTE
jgi:DNA repair photolyase